LADTSSDVDLFALPRIAHEEFNFRGVCLTTDLLAGADERLLNALRESADKAGCPTLSLIEPRPLALASRREGLASAAVDRLLRIVHAARTLGCSTLTIGIAPPKDGAKPEDVIALLAPRLRQGVSSAERAELNLLLTPTDAMFADPAIIAATLKKVGGFRVGSTPDFEATAKAPDPCEFLRQLTPYASCVVASSFEFTRAGRHKTYDIPKFLRTLRDLGYNGALVVEYRGDGDPSIGVRKTLALIDAIEAEDAS